MSSCKHLYLWNNAILEIYPGAFTGLSSCTQLQIQYNSLLNIQWGSFIQLNLLNFLNISKNFLETNTEEAFQDIPFCIELDLRANIISNLSVKGSLNKVETLYLENNLLNELTPRMFARFSSCKNVYL